MAVTSLDQAREERVPDDLYLIVDDSEESQAALDFVYHNGLNPHVFLGGFKGFGRVVPKVNANLFANSFEEPEVPFLVAYQSGRVSTWGYPSFSGIKVYAREKIEAELFGDKFGMKPERFWKNVRTFYSSSEGNVRQNLVTCFDQKGERIFEGLIDRAPHKLEAPLSRHGYDTWHEVSSWEIGGLDELQRMQAENGVIIKPETRTVLFPEDLLNLRNGRIVITEDSRSPYNVTYGAFFNDEGTITGLYANMFD